MSRMHIREVLIDISLTYYYLPPPLHTPFCTSFLTTIVNVTRFPNSFPSWIFDKSELPNFSHHFFAFIVHKPSLHPRAFLYTSCLGIGRVSRAGASSSLDVSRVHGDGRAGEVYNGTEKEIGEKERERGGGKSGTREGGRKKGKRIVLMHFKTFISPSSSERLGWWTSGQYVRAQTLMRI